MQSLSLHEETVPFLYTFTVRVPLQAYIFPCVTFFKNPIRREVPPLIRWQYLLQIVVRVFLRARWLFMSGAGDTAGNRPLNEYRRLEQSPYFYRYR